MSTSNLYHLGRLTMRLYTRLFLEMDVQHQSLLPNGAKIITPNHPTTIDPFLVPTYVDERVHILVTESAFKAPLFGRYLRSVGHVPVVAANGKAAFEAATNLLREGCTVAIFPEGALSPINGGFCEPHTGAVRLALLTGAAIIPIGIGLQREFIRKINTGIPKPDGEPEVAHFYAYGKYAVTSGKPLYLEGDVQDWAAVRNLTGQVMQHIKRLSQHSQYRIRIPTATVYDTAEFPGI